MLARDHVAAELPVGGQHVHAVVLVVHHEDVADHVRAHAVRLRQLGGGAVVGDATSARLEDPDGGRGAVGDDDETGGGGADVAGVDERVAAVVRLPVHGALHRQRGAVVDEKLALRVDGEQPAATVDGEAAYAALSDGRHAVPGRREHRHPLVVADGHVAVRQDGEVGGAVEALAELRLEAAVGAERLHAAVVAVDDHERAAPVDVDTARPRLAGVAPAGALERLDEGDSGRQGERGAGGGAGRGAGGPGGHAPRRAHGGAAWRRADGGAARRRGADGGAARRRRAGQGRAGRWSARQWGTRRRAADRCRRRAPPRRARHRRRLAAQCVAGERHVVHVQPAEHAGDRVDARRPGREVDAQLGEHRVGIGGGCFLQSARHRAARLHQLLRLAVPQQLAHEAGCGAQLAQRRVSLHLAVGDPRLLAVCGARHGR